MLGVSRTLVREALSQLGAEGLVQNIPHKGPIVSVIGSAEARGLYEVRAELEGFAGQLFTERASVAQRKALSRALKELERSVAKDEDPIMGFLMRKAKFYEILLEGTGNPVLTEILRVAHARIMMLRATTLSQPGRLEQSRREIAAIVDAVARNDPQAASLACRVHVQEAGKLAAEVLADIP